jgi:hypothetical protein
MKENKKVKTPRLTEKDREYLIKNESTLLVCVKSHAAACRYGAGSDWCTATPSYKGDYNRNSRSYRPYILFLDRNTEGEYKFWINASIRTGKIKDVYGWKDNQFKKESSVVYERMEQIRTEIQSS